MRPPRGTPNAQPARAGAAKPRVPAGQHRRATAGFPYRWWCASCVFPRGPPRQPGPAQMATRHPRRLQDGWFLGVVVPRLPSSGSEVQPPPRACTISTRSPSESRQVACAPLGMIAPFTSTATRRSASDSRSRSPRTVQPPGTAIGEPLRRMSMPYCGAVAMRKANRPSRPRSPTPSRSSTPWSGAWAGRGYSINDHLRPTHGSPTTANSSDPRRKHSRAQSLPDTLPYAVPRLEYDRSCARCSWGRACGCPASTRIPAPASRSGRHWQRRQRVRDFRQRFPRATGPLPALGRIAKGATTGIDLARPRV